MTKVAELSAKAQPASNILTISTVSPMNHAVFHDLDKDASLE